MNVDYTARHFSLDDRTRRFASGKLKKLDKFLEEPVDIHVILEKHERRQVAELLVHHRHGSVQGTSEAEEMFDAINSAVDKVEKQARRSRKKLIDKRRRAQRSSEEERHCPVEVLAADSFADEEGPRVVKTIRLPIQPMSVQKACETLEDSKNDFIVFLNTLSEEVNVLYRRTDENFGLIAPEI